MSTSKIENLIEEIEDYIENCKFKALSSSIILVNKEEIGELLRDLKMNTPDEIKRCQKIIQNKDAIMNDAKAKAQNLMQEALKQTDELISEHEIMQQAHARANEIVTIATMQAQDVLDQATIQSNDFKAQAMQYMDDSLGNLEEIITAAIHDLSTRYENLLHSLNGYRDLIQSNRAQLYPVNAMAETGANEVNAPASAQSAAPENAEN